MTVSRHAITRYCQRKGVQSRSAAEASIRELLQGAQPLELKRRWQTTEVLNHRDKAQFYRAAGLVFVIVGDRVKTCHDGAAKRWRKLSK